MLLHLSEPTYPTAELDEDPREQADGECVRSRNRRLEAEAVEHLVAALPVLLDTHTQVEVDLGAEDRLEV